MEWKLFEEIKPTKEGYYIVSCKTPSGTSYVCESFYNKKRKKFTDRDLFTHNDVIAWAKMPVPYQEG